MINHQSSIIIQYGSLGSRGPEPWDPRARSPGIPGPGALGSRGLEPWDPGGLSPAAICNCVVEVIGVITLIGEVMIVNILLITKL